jgi:hypothetical protein
MDNSLAPTWQQRKRSLLFELVVARLKFHLMLRLRAMVMFACLFAPPACLSGCLPGRATVAERQHPQFRRRHNLVRSQNLA